MSFANLRHGGLYVHLTYRGHPPGLDNYHWGLYLHINHVNGGTKYHITNRGIDGTHWITDHGRTAGVFKSMRLVGLFRIAQVSIERFEEADGIIRTFDESLNDVEGRTCRTWALEVMALLNEVSIVQCQSFEALNREILDWANDNVQSAVLAQQPRPLADSSLCVL